MTVPFIVPAYGGLLVLFYIFLGMRVSVLRGKAHATIGTGNDPALERAIRAHGNFSEYVPFALLLLGFMEMQRNSSYVLHALCLLLIAGRLIHAFGISQTRETMGFRVTGTVLTIAVLVIAAIVLIIDYFRIAAL
jgi:uncharacterized membrane protein YecN with MAPEG domain